MEYYVEVRMNVIEHVIFMCLPSYLRSIVMYCMMPFLLLIIYFYIPYAGAMTVVTILYTQK